MNKIKRKLLVPIHFPLFVACIGFVSTCIVSYKFKIFIQVDTRVYFIIIFLLILLVRFWSNEFTRNIFLLLVFSVIAVTRVSAVLNTSGNHALKLVGREGTFEATVVFDSSVGNDSKTIVRIKNTKGYILLKSSRFIHFWSGSKISFFGTILSPPNWEKFNYKEFLSQKNVYGIIQTNKVSLISAPTGYNGIIAKIKSYMIDAFSELLPQPHASLLTGMLIGDTNLMTMDFRTDLSDTGTSHIVAVSGYNISLILSSALILSGIFGKRNVLLFSMFFLTIFILMVGTNNLSAVRAYLMGIGLIMSNLSGRKGGAWVFLPLAAALILYMSPGSFLDLGFQLSFGATIGLMVFAKDIGILLANILPEFISEELSIILAANVIVLPIIVKTFGKVGVSGILVNLLVAPFIPIITLLGIVLTLFLMTPDIFKFMMSYFTFISLDFVISTIKSFSNIKILIFKNIIMSNNTFVGIYMIELFTAIFLLNRDD